MCIVFQPVVTGQEPESSPYFPEIPDLVSLEATEDTSQKYNEPTQNPGKTIVTYS